MQELILNYVAVGFISLIAGIFIGGYIKKHGTPFSHYITFGLFMLIAIMQMANIVIKDYSLDGQSFFISTCLLIIGGVIGVRLWGEKPPDITSIVSTFKK